jgi:hypothetical protein
VALDLAHAHAAGVHRHDLLIKARKAPLVFGNQLRIKSRQAITGDRQIDRAGVGQHGLAAIAVAGVAGFALLIEMMVHLGIERPLGESLLQLVEQPVLGKGRLGISARQQLIEQVVRNARFLAACHAMSPSRSS